jgi:hypothetical protein
MINLEEKNKKHYIPVELQKLPGSQARQAVLSVICVLGL